MDDDMEAAEDDSSVNDISEEDDATMSHTMTVGDFAKRKRLRIRRRGGKA
jgi:hypothetical protein